MNRLIGALVAAGTLLAVAAGVRTLLQDGHERAPRMEREEAGRPPVEGD